MIYPERMTPFMAATLIYSQCNNDGDSTYEFIAILEAIREAIDDGFLKWEPIKSKTVVRNIVYENGVEIECQTIAISRTDLKAWLEKFHPEMKPAFLFGTKGTPGDEIADILNPDHPWHSELLAIAIKGWLELYSNREGNSSDNTYKPSGGHIAMIEKWLSGQESSLLTKNSIGYLGKVINSSKGGGPNKTQE